MFPFAKAIGRPIARAVRDAGKHNGLIEIRLDCLAQDHLNDLDRIARTAGRLFATNHRYISRSRAKAEGPMPTLKLA